MSHDLLAPLTSIDGFSRILLESCSGRLDARGKDYLERVRAASQRMAQLIDDLLDLSKLSQHQIRRETVDLSALAREVAAEQQQRDPERNVEVAIAPGVTAAGDPRLLAVLMQNLIGNAWKFTGKRRKARVEFGAIEHEGGPAYFVRDDGAGFDMAYSDKLFGAFQRLHSAKDFPGNGIGLATVRRIVRRHGGRVWAWGAVDEGATFYFTLAPG